MKTEKYGLQWTEMRLYVDEIEPTQTRDKQEEIPVTIVNLKRELKLEENDEFEEDEYDDQTKRIQNILGVKNEEEMTVDEDNLTKYYKYLTTNINFSVSVTGIEDFHWEEYYVFGPGDQGEYKKLKKTHPSPSMGFRFRVSGFRPALALTLLTPDTRHLKP